MGTVQRLRRFFLLAIVCSSVLLASCSSGGGGKGSPASGGDTRPDTFALTAAGGADLTKVDFDTAIVSAPTSITGIDSAAPISVSGGEYSIGGGSFTSAPGTISNNQTVRVRVQSPIKAEQTATATLTIGGESATFAVTTAADTIAPEVAILFPPPASMTEGQTLFVRGTVKDVNGTLAQGAVTVNGVEAELTLNQAGDEGSWQVTVDLMPGENNLVVSAMDSAENTNEEVSVNSRRVMAIAGESFPDNENPFAGPLNNVIAEYDGELVSFVTDDTSLAVHMVDISTGHRTLVSDNNIQLEYPFEYPWGVVYDNAYLYVSDSAVPAIFRIDPINGSRQVISSANSAGQLMNEPRGIALADESSLYVADTNRVYKVDILTGEQSLVSSASENIPDAENPIEIAFGVAADVTRNRLYVADTGVQKQVVTVDPASGARTVLASGEFSALNAIASLGGDEVLVVDDILNSLFAVSLETGDVRVVSNGSTAGGINALSDPWGVAVYDQLGYSLITDPVIKAVFAVDLQSGNRVVLSKSVAP